MARLHLLALPLALLAADAAAQLDPGWKDFTRLDLAVTSNLLTHTSVVLTARTAHGGFAAGQEYWSLHLNFINALQAAGDGATLEFDASAGTEDWPSTAVPFPDPGALRSFAMPAVLPPSGWTEVGTAPPHAFFASTSNTANFGVDFDLVPPGGSSTAWGGSVTWYVLADAPPADYLVASGGAPTLTRRAAPTPARYHRWYRYTLTPQNL